MESRFRFRPPSTLPPALACAVSGGTAIVCAGLCSAGISGRLPEVAALSSGGLLEGSALRATLVAIGFLAGLPAVLSAAGSLRRLAERVACRWRWLPLFQTAAPARVIQGELGNWALRFELDEPGQARGRHSLLFPLDEGTAGAMSRAFDPDEVLFARWVELPSERRGPVLLQLDRAHLGAGEDAGDGEDSETRIAA